MRWFDIEKHSDGVWACVEINDDTERFVVTTLISTHSTRTAATTAANQLNRAERSER